MEVQRCQIHKLRNLKEYLPENCQKEHDRRIRNVLAMNNCTEAKAAAIRAARSLEEVLEQTLAVHRLVTGSVLRLK